MVLQYTYGQKSYELLKEKGIDVEFKTYAGMAHCACAEEFDDIADFFGFDTRRVVAVCNKYDEYLPYPYCTFTSNELHYNTTFFRRSPRWIRRWSFRSYRRACPNPG